jgi:hypothetical protein
MYSADIRWLVVYRRLVLLHPEGVVHEELGSCPTTQNQILTIFHATGEVFAKAAHKSTRGEERCLETALADVRLLEIVRDRPSQTQREISAILRLEGQKRVHVSSVCAAMKRLLITRQRLQRRHPSGDDWAAANFRMYLLTYWSADEILTGDETSKDLRALWRRYGYGPKGGVTCEYEPTLTRGGRVSALTYMSTEGFEAWDYTANTYDAPTFQQKTENMLLSPQADGRTIAQRFGVLILDGARIHTNTDWLLKMRCYIEVLIIPPYRHDLSPLDNGAYGWVVQFLQRNNLQFAHDEPEVGLDAAFEAFPRAAARHAYHNCLYL